MRSSRVMSPGRLDYQDGEAPGTLTAVPVDLGVPETSSSGSRGRAGPSRGKSKTLRHLAGIEFPSPAVAAARHHGGAPADAEVFSAPDRKRHTFRHNCKLTNLQTNRVGRVWPLATGRYWPRGGGYRRWRGTVSGNMLTG